MLNSIRIKKANDDWFILFYLSFSQVYSIAFNIHTVLENIFF